MRSAWLGGFRRTARGDMPRPCFLDPADFGRRALGRPLVVALTILPRTILARRSVVTALLAVPAAGVALLAVPVAMPAWASLVRLLCRGWFAGPGDGLAD